MRVSAFVRVPAKVALPMMVKTPKGEAGSKEFRLFFENEKRKPVSAWHHLPRRPEGATEPTVFTFVAEIPRLSRAKMELLKEEKHNPIAQDIFKKKPGQPLRFFTYGDLPFNYGFIPQTWENPDLVDADTNCNGDGDPIDVVHIGATAATGDYSAARVLGVLGLIDEGETDWKIITEDAGADGFGHISKVPAEVRDTIVDWFRNYKTTDGKKQNEFAFGGEIKGAEEAIRIIHECGTQYDHLLQGSTSRHGYWLPTPQ